MVSPWRHGRWGHRAPAVETAISPELKGEAKGVLQQEVFSTVLSRPEGLKSSDLLDSRSPAQEERIPFETAISPPREEEQGKPYKWLARCNPDREDTRLRLTQGPRRKGGVSLETWWMGAPRPRPSKQPSPPNGRREAKGVLQVVVSKVLSRPTGLKGSDLLDGRSPAREKPIHFETAISPPRERGRHERFQV